MKSSTKEITGLLQRAGQGDEAALAEVIPHVYADLRQQANRFLAGERAGHTLQATALVHEAWLRLVDIEQVRWADRAHFLAVAATCMRRILVDHARRRRAVKRGGGANSITFRDSHAFAAETTDGVLALDEGIHRLAKLDARKARLVELKLFAGLENAEAAEAQGVSLATVERDWRLAKAWLHRELCTGDR